MARRKRKRKLTKEQAIVKLRETKELSTDLLEPLGISFESFLRFAQLSDARANAIVDKLIASYGGA